MMLRMLFVLLFPVSFAQAAAPAGTFTAGQCVECHATATPALVAGWRSSVHGPQRAKGQKNARSAGCKDCHGGRHQGSLVKARRVSACIGCHADTTAAVHSYATSKHAVIVRLEEDAWDWNKPLQWGNYRAPSCAYCHLHQARHDMGGRPNAAGSGTASVLRPFSDGQQSVCRDCHAPRYVAEQFGSGERALNIAGMKLREAEQIARQAGVAETKPLLARMQNHARNIRVGVGHQSPDYQWWHGQPALDGDLLRIKGVLDIQLRSDETRKEAQRQ